MTPQPNQLASRSEADFKGNLARRQRRARFWSGVYMAANLFALLALVLLFTTIINQIFGLSVLEYTVKPSDLSAQPLETLSETELGAILIEKVDKGRLLVLVRDNLLGKNTSPDRIYGRIASDMLAGQTVAATGQPVKLDATISSKPLTSFDQRDLIALLSDNLSAAQMAEIVLDVLPPAGKTREEALKTPMRELFPDKKVSIIVRAKALETLEPKQIATFLTDNLTGAERMALLSEVQKFLLPPDVSLDEALGEPVSKLFSGRTFNPAISDMRPTELDSAGLVSLMTDNLSTEQLQHVVNRDVVAPRYPLNFPLFQSWLDRASVETEASEKFPGRELVWRSWLNWEFLTTDLTRDPSTTGLIMAITGTVYILVLTVLISLPLGIGAAIYLEEYAKHSPLTDLLETVIRNLAGVPSIIYGMLGLAVFVRALGDQAGITNGALFGFDDRNGRTILSAALTMSLLILPVIIINSQEAIRAVPSSLREASYGIGATRWQTVWRTVLPASTPGILTGVILSMSRAVGETAPLLVVGGLTFLTVPPSDIFAKFTVIPIQVYSWTSEPNPAFRNVAAAAIITLLILLLALNATAIIVRQRYSKRLRG